MRHHGKMRKSARQYLCQLRELTAFPGILRVLLTQGQVPGLPETGDGTARNAGFARFARGRGPSVARQAVVTLRKHHRRCRDDGSYERPGTMKARMRRPRLQRLSTQVVVMMVAILAVTMAAGFVVVQWNLTRQLD